MVSLYSLVYVLKNQVEGSVFLQKVDLVAAPLFVTRYRRRVVDFTRPFMTVGATILIRKPPHGETQ